MMKRVLTLLLTLALCLGLPCAALADAPKDTDPPQWEQWGFDSLEEYLELWGSTEEEYYEEIAYAVAMEQEYPAWKAAYLADHPGYLDTLLAEDAEDPMWQWFGYESVEEFEEIYGAAYVDCLVDLQLENVFSQQWYMKRILQQRVERGGPAEGVGVMWMGEYVQFPDAQPVIQNGRTMVPVRALMECTGAAVDYQDGQVLLSVEEEQISFTPGKLTAEVQNDGEADTLQMDVAPYIEQGRTYVPLRFFSQALGYEVLWDDTYKTAVILDPERIIAQLDQSFQTVNSFLAARMKEVTGAKQSEGTVNGTLTIFDSMDGDQTASLSGSAVAVVEDNNVDLRMELDIEDLLKLLLDQTQGGLDEADEEELELLLAAVRSVEMIYDAEDGMAYVRIPGLAALQEELTEDTWLTFDMMPVDEEVLTETQQSCTVGALIYLLKSEYDGIDTYDSLMETGAQLAKWIGDDCFVDVPEGKQLHITAEQLLENIDLLDELEPGEEFDFSLTLCMKEDGSAKLDGMLRIKSGLFGGKGSLELFLSDEQVTMKLLVHVRNMMELTLSMQSAITDTTETPRKAPPAGAPQVDYYELIGSIELFE